MSKWKYEVIDCRIGNFDKSNEKMVDSVRSKTNGVGYLRKER